MHRSRIAAAAAVAAVVLGAASPASAHEHRTVGRYELEVGWASEPTYAGVQNAVQVTITDTKGTPVDDLGDPGLTVTVSTGTATSDPLSLGLSFDPDSSEGTHGQFLAAVIPTRPGEYTFRVTGSIKGQAVDEKFTSGDTTFDPVKEPRDIEFPAKDPSAGELATSVQRLSPRVDNAVAAAKDAKDKASTATTLAIVALVVGVAIGGAGLVIGLGARRRA